MTNEAKPGQSEMKKAFVILSLLALVGCDGNPFKEDSGTPDPESGGSSLYGTDLNADLTMNSLAYDPDTDQVVINNIPFDGATAANGQALYGNVGGLGASGFSRYENLAGNRSYYAVFRRSASGNSQAGATGTDSYIGYGFGGVTAQRLNGNTNMPNVGEYVFTGEYAAVRVFDESVEGAPGGSQYITGEVELDVDIRDFDVTGAVEGVIFNRVLYDQSGNAIGAMDDFITLATAEIDFENQSINASTASGVGGADSKTLTTGDWAGVFAGPTGEEVAGIVILEGKDENDASLRETGVFIAIRQP